MCCKILSCNPMWDGLYFHIEIKINLLNMQSKLSKSQLLLILFIKYVSFTALSVSIYLVRLSSVSVSTFSSLRLQIRS